MSIKPPVLPTPTQEYSTLYMDELIKTLSLFFRTMAGYQNIQSTTIRVDDKNFPTEADIANIRSGTVYIDTQADNVLKVKP